jgi:hypothetical protein
MPADRDGFLDRLADLWRAQSSDEGLERAMSLSSRAGLSARRRRLGRRRDAATRLVADVHTGTEVEGRSLRAAVLLLTSTTAHRHLREYWAMTTDEAAATAAWAVWTLIAGARQPH